MASAERWLVRGAEIAGHRRDCRIRDGVIAELGQELPLGADEQVMDAAGGALLPGLADHHLHLRASAAALHAVNLAGGELPGADAAVRMTPGPDGWLRVIGAGRGLTRDELDAVWPEFPVRVQHRSGALWTLNSAALARLGDGTSYLERTTGQFWRSGQRLRELMSAVSADTTVAVAEMTGLLLSYGVTHVTDATPDLDPAALAAPLHSLSLAESGAGPRKIVIADHEPPMFDALVAAVTAEHARDRGVALHAVTASALAVAIAALNTADPHRLDRIEHAAVCSDDAAERLAQLDLTVVTQPTLLTRFGRAYLAESAPEERALLWRYGGLLSAGVRTVASSDSPYGDANPWKTIQAASRREVEGVVVSPDERVRPEVVVNSLMSSLEQPGLHPRVVAVGAPADLCLLGADLVTSLERAVRTGENPVRATFVDGCLLFHRRADPA